MRRSMIRSKMFASTVGRRTMTRYLGAVLLPMLVVCTGAAWYWRTQARAAAMSTVQRDAELTAVILNQMVFATHIATTDQRVTVADTLSTAHASTLARVLQGERASVCIFATKSWRRVFCTSGVTTAGVIELRKLAQSTILQTDESLGTTFIAAHRDVLLHNSEGATEWRIVASVAQDSLLPPDGLLVRALLLIVALAAVSALATAYLEMRHTIAPLFVLRDAVHAISAGDLATSVHIDSLDEYGALGTAFNSAMQSIARRISRLHRLDAVSEASLRMRRVSPIIEVALEGLRQTRDIRLAEIAVVHEHDSSRITLWSIDPRSPQVHRTDAVLSADVRSAWLEQGHRIHSSNNTPRSVSAQGGGAPSHTTRMVLPMLYANALMGAITLDLTGTASDHVDTVTFARSIADRIALGITRVRLLPRDNDVHAHFFAHVADALPLVEHDEHAAMSETPITPREDDAHSAASPAALVSTSPRAAA